MISISEEHKLLDLSIFNLYFNNNILYSKYLQNYLRSKMLRNVSILKKMLWISFLFFLQL